MTNLEKYQYQQMFRRQALLSEYAKQSFGGYSGNSFNTAKVVDGSNGFLYYAEYSPDRLDRDKAIRYFKTGSMELPSGGCTGVFAGGKVLRQLDWYYDEEVEFIVKMNPDPKLGIYGSIGCSATSPSFRRSEIYDILLRGDYYEKFDILPYLMVDGVNEKGIFAQSNVVNKNGIVVDVNPGSKRELCFSIMTVRHILDHLGNLDDLDTLFDGMHLFETSKIGDFLPHVLVSDGTSTKIVEFKANGVEIVDGFPIMTNFRTNGGFDVVEKGEDWHADWGTVEENGIGVERWNLGADFIERGNYSFQDFSDLRNKLTYSRAYTHRTESEDDPIWLTDALDDGLTVQDAEDCHIAGTVSPQFQTVLDREYQKYVHRQRGNKQTWITTHSSIYDIPNRKFNIQVQEGNVDALSWDIDFDGNIKRN